jgi:hypothetical protein
MTSLAGVLFTLQMKCWCQDHHPARETILNHMSISTNYYSVAYYLTKTAIPSEKLKLNTPQSKPASSIMPLTLRITEAAL